MIISKEILKSFEDNSKNFALYVIINTILIMN